MKSKPPVQRFQLKADCAKLSGIEADQAPQFILETIEFGYKLPFLTSPPARIFRNIKSRLFFISQPTSGRSGAIG